jgi:lipoprotein-anchoring transpeptidase ErfK/SrfK
MNRFFKSAAAATLILAGLLSSSAFAEVKKPFAGVVIVPASAQPELQSATENQLSFKRGKIVIYATDKKPGSIIVNTKTNQLYYVLGLDRAVMYRVASAKPGFEWAGTNKVSAKTQWPDWRPPVEMQARRPELPTFMAQRTRWVPAPSILVPRFTAFMAPTSQNPSAKLHHQAASAC